MEHGKLATVVTVLEMQARPKLRPLPASRLKLVRWSSPSPAAYRALFRRIGEPWLWFSRLDMTDDELGAVIQQATTQIYAVTDHAGIEVGLLELSYPEPDWCSLDFFGLVPELAGQGEGRWLMANALALAWLPDVRFVRVHTCTLDHPGALRFYLREGFVAVKRELETFADPRLTGLIPRDAAPQIPLIV